MNTEPQQDEVSIEALAQVSGGRHRRHRVHHASPQQSGQQPPPVADLAAIVTGAIIKF